MALDAKFNAFKVKYSLGDEAMAEMLSIFNDSFIELAHKLLSSNDIEVPKKKQETQSKSKTSSGTKKFATKIAAEYAAENELTLDDFDKEKITKKDIDELIKATVGTKKKAIPKLDTTPPPEKKKEIVSKEKCGGITKNGEPCNRPGTEKPDGSSKCFCFRHAMDWKMYEVSSDSDLEEEEIFKDPNEKIDIPDLAISTED
tara:strand:+ start:10818 stop:11420 length:603 start_codon:yes stop_codon:yes gene_type:complete